MKASIPDAVISSWWSKPRRIRDLSPEDIAEWMLLKEPDRPAKAVDSRIPCA